VSLSPRQPPTPTLFPYTTLFRSGERVDVHPRRHQQVVNDPVQLGRLRVQHLQGQLPTRRRVAQRTFGEQRQVARHDRERRSQLRSEEHTSELQSPYDLVCRLLLE